MAKKLNQQTSKSQQAPSIVPIMEVAGGRGERYGLAIMQGFIVPLRSESGDEWKITGQIPRKLAEYIPVFISQHDAMIERGGFPVSVPAGVSVAAVKKPRLVSAGLVDEDATPTPAASKKKPLRTRAKPVGVIGIPKARAAAPVRKYTRKIK